MSQAMSRRDDSNSSKIGQIAPSAYMRNGVASTWKWKRPSTSREFSSPAISGNSFQVLRSWVRSTAVSAEVRSGRPNSRPLVRKKRRKVATRLEASGVHCHTRSWPRTTASSARSSPSVACCAGMRRSVCGALAR